jgi:hypothetical protein
VHRVAEHLERIRPLERLGLDMPLTDADLPRPLKREVILHPGDVVQRVLDRVQVNRGQPRLDAIGDSRDCALFEWR